MATERNSNQVPSLQVKSNAADDADVILWADPSTHRLLVDISSGGGTSMTDDAAFTPGTTPITPAGAMFDDTTPDSVNEGDGGVLRMSANRNLYAQIRDASGSERGLNVDASGRIGITIEADNVGIGGGTQYAEDSTHSTGATGTLALVVRQDTPGNLSGTDGDYEALQVSGGRLWASTLVTGDALTALQLIDDIVFTDDAAFTPGTSKVAMVGAEFDDITPDSVDEGDAGALRMSANRNLYTQIRDAAGNERGANVNASNELLVALSSVPSHAVTNAGTFAVQVDAALPAGTNAIGKLSANSGVDIGDVDVTSITGVTMSNDAIQTTGDEAHDAADAGNPVKIGFKGYAFDGTAPQTAVAEADRVNAISDLQGIQYVQISHPMFWHVSADYASAQTNATVKAAPGAGLKLYVTDVIISNGATAGNITLLDGSGGTVLLELYPAINGGMTHSFRNPIALTANTLLAITSTTVTTHSVTISGFIAA